MKRHFYFFSILFLACGQTDNRNENHSYQDSIRADSEIAKQAPDTIDTNESLEIFRDFSLNYSPSGFSFLPEASDTVLKAMNRLKVEQPDEFEKYLSLIFVKLYSAHLTCCHQSYEVRKQPPSGLDKERDPFVYEFNQLAKTFPEGKRIEFISSHLGYDYVKANPHLLAFKPIKEQVEIIEQINQNIKKGVYWK